MADQSTLEAIQNLDLDSLYLGKGGGEPLVRIPSVFLDRATELYSPVLDDNGNPILDKSGNAISLDDQLNEGRFSLGTGVRSRVIDSIVAPGFLGTTLGSKFNQKLIDELAADYDPVTKKFKTKLGFEAFRAGVTPDDIVKAVVALGNAERRDHPMVRDANIILKKSGREAINSVTSGEEIKDVVAAEKIRTGLLKDIGGEVKGAAFLKAYRDKYGPRLSNPQLRQVLAEAQNRDPNVVAERDNLKQQTKSLKKGDELKGKQLTLEKQIAAAANRIQEDSLDITRTQAENQLELGKEQVALERAQLTGENTRQQQLLDHQTAVANKNTDLQLALAQINRSDRQDERAYDRERDDRDRRQALMVMLMQGLGNLGRTFGSGL